MGHLTTSPIASIFKRVWLFLANSRDRIWIYDLLGMIQTSFQTAPLCVIFYKQKINDCTVKRKAKQQCNRRLLYQHIFYSDIHNRLRFIHNLNQFAKNLYKNCTKSFNFHLKHKCFNQIWIIRSFICLGFSPNIFF